jgi:hypothetical protein
MREQEQSIENLKDRVVGPEIDGQLLGFDR